MRSAAVTYDSTTGEAVQYFESKKGNEVSREVSKVTVSACVIAKRGWPLKVVVFPARNLNGRIDKFLIDQESLSGDEIANLCELEILN